jgi:hypothetical protein
MCSDSQNLRQLKGVIVTDSQTYQQKERFCIVNHWAEKGVSGKRSLLPIEKSFQERISKVAEPLFVPLPLRDNGCPKFNREMSYLIDAFDDFPRRVDQSFDSLWKALESTLSTVDNSSQITQRLKKVADTGYIDARIIDRICKEFPLQSCEYLYKRIASSQHDNRALRRVKDLNEVNKLIEYTKCKYNTEDDKDRRDAAILFRKLLSREERIQVADDVGFRFSDKVLARILISGFLYTARNDRFHGNSFSPFVSSYATIRTYTHPYFAFLATYYLLIGMWQRQHPEVISLDDETLFSSFNRNARVARQLFGRHWNN